MEVELTVRLTAFPEDGTCRGLCRFFACDTLPIILQFLHYRYNFLRFEGIGNEETAK